MTRINSILQKLKPAAFVALIIGVTIFFFLLPWDNWIDQRPYAQEIKRANDPYHVVYRFLRALIDDNIRLANELVISEQRERLDRWRDKSNHKAHTCKYIWKWILIDPLQMTWWAGGSEDDLDINTREINIAFGCTNDNFLMSIENAIVKFDGVEWTIIDWEMICERPPSYDKDETCYH